MSTTIEKWRKRAEPKMFLSYPLKDMELLEISDGEITIKAGKVVATLYLDHELNEGQGFPKSFTKGN